MAKSEIPVGSVRELPSAFDIGTKLNRTFVEKLIRRLSMTQARQATALQDTTDQLEAARAILDGLSRDA